MDNKVAFAAFPAQELRVDVSVFVSLCRTMNTKSCVDENVVGARRNAITMMSRTTVMFGEITFGMAELKL